MIHPDVIVGTFELGRRIPVEAGLVLAHLPNCTHLRPEAVHQCQYGRITPNSLRIIGKNVVAIHAVAGGRRAVTDGHTGLQTAVGVDQKRRVTGDRGAIYVDRPRTKRKIPVRASEV